MSADPHLADELADQRLDLGRLLRRVEESPPADAVEVLAAELAQMVDATEVNLLIANFSGTAVMRLSHVAGTRGSAGRNERTESLTLTDSVHHRVMVEQEVSITRQEGAWLVLVPVTERGDAIGLLELVLDQHPDETTVDYLVSAAHALGYVLIASRRHTDLFEWSQRDLPFSHAAEIQRNLLPSSYTLEAGRFTLAGWLEPASEVGGDTFDYSLDREHLYASITDARGHSVDSALLASFTVGSLRNSRRALLGPAEQADAANAALLELDRPEEFVTGQLLRVCLADGTAELVNAGHVFPFLVRGGGARVLDLEHEPALGFLPHRYRTQRLVLEPGDRLVQVTDGFLERNASTIAIDEVLVATAGDHPREVVRDLASRLLITTGGMLQDDATVLCVDWHGPDAVRRASGGADAQETGT